MEVWIDNVKKVDYKKIIFRINDSVKVDKIAFSTFFGGGSPDWASPVDTYTLFKNFAFYDY